MKCAALILSLTLSSAAVAGEVLIPAVYRGGGANGSQWRTEIAIANVSTQMPLPVPVDVIFYPGTVDTKSVRLPIAVLENVKVADALQEWFGVESGGGIVRVTWDDAHARIIARARIYNVQDGVEFGQGMPAVDVGSLQHDSYLTGLSGTNGNRTNVGVSNPHGGDAVVWVSLFDTNGLSYGEISFLVPPLSYRQINDIFQWFQTAPFEPALIRVRSFDRTVYAYASVVRNDTGDATFVTPAR